MALPDSHDDNGLMINGDRECHDNWETQVQCSKVLDCQTLKAQDIRSFEKQQNETKLPEAR